MATHQIYLNQDEERLISKYKKRGESIPTAVKRLVIEKLEVQ